MVAKVSLLLFSLVCWGMVALETRRLILGGK